MSTKKIREKYGTVARYAERKGWKAPTLRRLLCGKMMGFGRLGSAMIAQMKRDKVWGE
ncbi:MAG: hypothetical protein WA003_15680 [Desulfuromonadaceae bacterium]